MPADPLVMHFPDQLTPIEAKNRTKKIAETFVQMDSMAGEFGIMVEEFKRRGGYAAMGYPSLKHWIYKCLPNTPVSTVKHHLLIAEVRISLGDWAMAFTKQQVLLLGHLDEDIIEGVAKSIVDEADKDDDGEPIVTAKAVASAIKKLKKKAKAPVEESEEELLTPAGEKVLTAKLRLVFGDLTDIEALLRSLSSFKMAMEEVAETPAGVMVASFLTELEHRRLHLYDGIASTMPYAICPYCGGDKDCRVCNNAGWVNKSTHSQRKAKVPA